jgi:hypothetical protein
MIAVLASRLDPEASALIEAWSASGAALLSAEDLITSGWRFSPGNPGTGSAVVDGRRIKVADLTAVLTRRPAVLAEELTRIASADRAYVAAEINAFLIAWLAALTCPVVNRPTPTSLCGPAWSDLHWRMAAARVGLQWSESSDMSDAHSVLTCGADVLWAKTAAEADGARALAGIAGAALLGVRFRGQKVCSISVAPPLMNAEVQACLLRHLTGVA